MKLEDIAKRARRVVVNAKEHRKIPRSVVERAKALAEDLEEIAAQLKEPGP